MIEQDRVNMEFYVAGLKFHQFREVEDELIEGLELDLVPEPTNRFDPNAIRLMLGNTMIGFVPAKTGEATYVAGKLKAGISLQATVIKYVPERDHYRRLKVSVKNL